MAADLARRVSRRSSTACCGTPRAILRPWGTQHWFANLSCYYEALFAANRLDLLDPVFSMYSGMYDAAATAARQQWGSQGIYIPETVWHDGLATLPDDIADGDARSISAAQTLGAAQRAISRVRAHRTSALEPLELVGRRPLDQRRVDAHRTSHGAVRPGQPHSWARRRRSPTSTGAGMNTRRIAAWLRDRAYPMIKGAAEFYRHFPNLRKEADGKYHIHHVNSNESVMGAHDTDEDLSAMRGIFAAAIRASEVLGPGRAASHRMAGTAGESGAAADQRASGCAARRRLHGPACLRARVEADRQQQHRLHARRQQPAHVVLRSRQPGIAGRADARRGERDLRSHVSGGYWFNDRCGSSFQMGDRRHHAWPSRCDEVSRPESNARAHGRT